MEGLFYHKRKDIQHGKDCSITNERDKQHGKDCSMTNERDIQHGKDWFYHKRKGYTTWE